MKYESFLKFKYGTHSLIVNQIPNNANVLDIGCAQGYLDEYLTKKLNCVVTGIELDAKAAQKAKKFCKKIFIGDIEKILQESQLGNEKFDIILLADVLEHLKEPERVLQEVKKYLKSEGSVIVSLPNIAYFQIRCKILLGSFEYTDRGILDCTHLKFFTRHSMNKMFSRCGLDITKQIPVGNLSCLLGKLGLIIDRTIPGLFAVQFLSVLKKKTVANN